MLTLIAALGRNRVIGRDGDLPWRDAEDRPVRLTGDLARFKRLTQGQVVVMGRRTYDSIGRPLPGRQTVVVTRDRGWLPPDLREQPTGGTDPLAADGTSVAVAHSLDEALAVAALTGRETWVAGGGEIYTLALDRADALELTEVDAAPDGDTWFPAYDDGTWTEVAREPRDGFAWVRYERAP